MILAPQQRAPPLGPRADRIRPMPTDVVEGAQFVVFAQDENEAEVREREGPVGAWLGEERGVADVEPGFGEDGALFEGCGFSKGRGLVWGF